MLATFWLVTFFFLLLCLLAVIYIQVIMEKKPAEFQVSLISIGSSRDGKWWFRILEINLSGARRSLVGLEKQLIFIHCQILFIEWF